MSEFDQLLGVEILGARCELAAEKLHRVSHSTCLSATGIERTNEGGRANTSWSEA